MTDYVDVVEATVKREIEILGERAIEVAEESGAKVDEEGNVKDLEKEGEKVFEELVDNYVEIGGEVTARLIANEIEDMALEGLELPAEISGKMPV